MTDSPNPAEKEPDFSHAHHEIENIATLANARIAIIGLGLMGGSLALALQNRCKTLLAVDPDPTTRAFAREHQIVDQILANPADILPQANLIILASPIREILRLIHQLPNLHPGRAIVMDIGSTKTEIIQAFAHLPTRFDPLGGHPICGKETSGLSNADASLFVRAPFSFTALNRTSASARALAEELAQTIGAKSLWLDAFTHDRWVATTSHLPYLLAAALSLATPSEVASLIGPGFRSSTRLAASHPKMMADILTSNRNNLLDSLTSFRAQLSLLEEELTHNHSDALEDLLTRVMSRRLALIPNDRRPTQP